MFPGWIPANTTVTQRSSSSFVSLYLHGYKIAAAAPGIQTLHREEAGKAMVSSSAFYSGSPPQASA